MERECVGLLDVAGEIAVARGLARLALQVGELDFDFLNDVADAREVLLRGVELEFRLVAARVQARNAGGFFKNGAARDGLGIDELANLSLLHQCGRMCARRCIGKEDLHVTCAHVAAIDLVDRAHVALDPARDLELFRIVVLRRCAAQGIVDDEGHFRRIAARPVVGAREDDVVHGAAAHGLRRILAHHPAQRFQKVGLAAAIGAHDPGEARFDGQFGGFNE